MKIWAHCLVKNEENFIWYALNSIISWVDGVIVWDTGSTDKTVQIIKEVQKTNPLKIKFREYGPVTPEEHTKARQEMLEGGKGNWILILDGDEVWWEESIRKLMITIREGKGEFDSLTVRTINPVGDIYHYQEESAGQYEIAGKKGHFNLRAFSKDIPGLHLGGVYPREAYFDEKKCPIQERDGVKFLDVSYFHLTNLVRSRKGGVVGRNRKIKYEFGIPFPRDFYYPEVFFKGRPNFVPSPWKRLRGVRWIFSAIETPPKRLKRII